MSDDKKLDFYFQNYEVIDQWVDLRQEAIDRMDGAIINAVQQMNLDDVLRPVPIEVRQQDRLLLQFALGETRRDQQCIELSWVASELFRPGTRHEWPTIALVAHPRTDPQLRAEIFQATKEYADSRSFERSGTGWWIRHKALQPTTIPFDIDEYAQYCAQFFFEVWDAVSEKEIAVIERFNASITR